MLTFIKRLLGFLHVPCHVIVATVLRHGYFHEFHPAGPKQSDAVMEITVLLWHLPGVHSLFSVPSSGTPFYFFLLFCLFVYDKLYF